MLITLFLDTMQKICFEKYIRRMVGQSISLSVEETIDLNSKMLKVHIVPIEVECPEV
jgi:hypothetical protein